MDGDGVAGRREVAGVWVGLGGGGTGAAFCVFKSCSFSAEVVGAAERAAAAVRSVPVGAVCAVAVPAV
eukprot:7273396-Prorocentrum_lima.AAC.1